MSTIERPPGAPSHTADAARAPAGSDSELSAAEQRVLAWLQVGKRAHCEGATLRASFIRKLALELSPEFRIEPAGVRIHDAIIEGRLDLEGCVVEKPLLFFGCTFGQSGLQRVPIELRDAQLRRLGLYGCEIHGGMRADRMEVKGSVLMRGLRSHGFIGLRGARVGGALRMEEMSVVGDRNAINMDDVAIEGPWILRGSEITGALHCVGTRIAGSALLENAIMRHVSDDEHGSVLIADALHVDGPFVANKADFQGGLQLRGARLRGLMLDDAKVSNGQVAILADEIDCKSSVSLCRLRATGTIVFEGMKLDGNLVFEDATIDGNKRGAVFDGSTIEGWASFNRSSFKGLLAVPGMRISDRLRAQNVQIDADHYAILAEGLKVGQSVDIGHARLNGSVNLMGAAIGVSLMANNLEINSNGRAIEADVLRVGGNWIMRGARIEGNLRFPGADIGGQIAFTETQINGRDLAIRADGSRIRGGWFMGRAKIKGVVRLPSCEIGNQFRIRGTEIRVSVGPALVLNGTRITRDVVLDAGFSTHGGISLDQAEIGGVLDLDGCVVRSALLGRGGTPAKYEGDDDLVSSYDDRAISIVDARIDRMRMPNSATCRPHGIIDFSRAHVGTFEDFFSGWAAAIGQPDAGGTPRGHDLAGRDVDFMILDGFVYDHLENPEGGADGGRRRGAARARIAWLEGQGAGDLVGRFKPQPWVQMASRLAAQGFAEDAQAVSIARRRRYRQSASISWGGWLQSLLLDRFALFGYNPWRTVAWMFAFVLAFAVVWQFAASQCERSGCADERVFVRSDQGRFASSRRAIEQDYPPFNALAYSFDLFIPIVNFGYQDYWRPRLDYGPFARLQFPPSGQQFRQLTGRPPDAGRDVAPWFSLTLTWGGVLYILQILEMIVGLVLTSLAITGFTGLLKRDE